MKILYAIQGTGNGHLSRAMEIVPILKRKADVDVLVSGIQSDLKLPFKIDYQYYGLSFIFGKSGGIDFVKTYRKSRLRKLRKEIKTLPVEKYDLIISDFEPVSCWAGKAKEIPVIGLSNQAAVFSEGAPVPEKFDPIGKFVLKKYAPCDVQFGFHFQKYNKQIFTPIIRKIIRDSIPVNLGHYTVYLPSFDDKKIVKRLNKFKSIKWEVFSKHCKKAYQDGNIYVYPIDNDAFLRSLISCEGILCGAGFATPSEALYLKKKLMVIPMKSQFEQQCNALALTHMGVAVIPSLRKRHLSKIEEWLKNDSIIAVNYPDETEKIIDLILEERKKKFIKPIRLKSNKAS
ncbi:MAG: glycosyl transferase [Flavobacteriales bacterium]|nr:glycosyl transferase [Flavobacteriales bacterium]